ESTSSNTENSSLANNCSGTALCFKGKVTQVIDGDTIKVDGKSIRFALSSAPELYERGGQDARQLIENICPVGSTALVDQDDGQTQGSYGRLLGVIYCNGVNLNSKLLDEGLGYIASEFCSSSEFSFTSWAQKHGCLSNDSSTSDFERCDSSYPDICVPSPPPDLDCKDIPYRNFTVLYPDPHNFDGDGNGIGCER
ncbi:MAG: thermonuclease family protein, partial [Nitrosopumilaceae archaeon]|nr:thermonuclease family protein [Nitrosopumilaceae archaeon]